MAGAYAKAMVEAGIFKDPSETLDFTRCVCDGEYSVDCLYGWCDICDYPDVCKGNHGNLAATLNFTGFPDAPVATPLATPVINPVASDTEVDDVDVVDGRASPPPPPVVVDLTGPGDKRKSVSKRVAAKKVPKRCVLHTNAPTLRYPYNNIPLDIIALRRALEPAHKKVQYVIQHYPGEEERLIDYLFSLD